MFTAFSLTFKVILAKICCRKYSLPTHGLWTVKVAVKVCSLMKPYCDTLVELDSSHDILSKQTPEKQFALLW